MSVGKRLSSSNMYVQMRLESCVLAAEGCQQHHDPCSHFRKISRRDMNRDKNRQKYHVESFRCLRLLLIHKYPALAYNFQVVLKHLLARPTVCTFSASTAVAQIVRYGRSLLLNDLLFLVSSLSTQKGFANCTRFLKCRLVREPTLPLKSLRP